MQRTRASCNVKPAPKHLWITEIVSARNAKRLLLVNLNQVALKAAWQGLRAALFHWKFGQTQGSTRARFLFGKKLKRVPFQNTTPCFVEHLLQTWTGKVSLFSFKKRFLMNWAGKDASVGQGGAFIYSFWTDNEQWIGSGQLNIAVSSPGMPALRPSRRTGHMCVVLPPNLVTVTFLLLEWGHSVESCPRSSNISQGLSFCSCRHWIEQSTWIGRKPCVTISRHKLGKCPLMFPSW